VMGRSFLLQGQEFLSRPITQFLIRCPLDNISPNSKKLRRDDKSEILEGTSLNARAR
jgi:hypothetical protein